VPLVVPKVIVIVAFPAATAVTSPVLLTAIALGLDEIHVPEAVRFCVLPSVYMPVALSCCAAPINKLAALGMTLMEVRFGGATVKVTEVEADSNPPVSVAVP
jgi:hypothetical protein